MENNSITFSLREIAKWTDKCSNIKIPALQRGLVWKPRQVELLWDSLLRGFPIGSFLLSEADNNQYYLLDGQQRYNAISLGFNTVSNAKSVVWIDLKPKKQTERKYWIKVTTEAHPWGFYNDDECSILDVNDRRKAAEAFGFKDKNIYRDDFSLLETWPIEAGLPIPLYIILNIDAKTPSEFCDKVLSELQKCDFVHKAEIDNEALAYMKDYVFKAIQRIENYKISCNLLTKDVIADEGDVNNKDNDQTALELLFKRLNTGGTVISQEDLAYSSIKAFWPEIQEINDSLAKDYMPPAKLATLTFGLLLTDKNKKLGANTTPKQIRKWAEDENVKQIVLDFYQNGSLKKTLSRIDHWLGVNDENDMHTPALLRTSMAYSSPSLYQFLMYLAKSKEENPDNFYLSNEQIKSLAFGIHWFVVGDINKVVQLLFSCCKNGINISNIRKGISSCQHEELLLPIYTPEEVKYFFEVGESPRWRYWDVPQQSWFGFYARIKDFSSYSKEMLLYSERRYINNHFPKYDPARKDMWENYNRPWDYDHIVPQEWAKSRSANNYREFVQNWVWSIGNFAAISFEANRGKGCRNDFSEYNDEYKDSLLYDEGFSKITEDLSYNDKISIDFVKLAKRRIECIYERVYEILQPVFEETELSDNLHNRKNVMEKVMKNVPDSKLYYVYNGQDVEADCHSLRDWTHEWIGIGVVFGDYYVCLESDASYNDIGNQYFELGIRKAPGTQISNDKRNMVDDLAMESFERCTGNEWWYYYKDASKLDDKEIIEDIHQMIKEVKMAIQE
jgi:hypothetical protein